MWTGCLGGMQEEGLVSLESLLGYLPERPSQPGVKGNQIYKFLD